MKKIQLELHCEYSDAELSEKRDEIANVIIGAHLVERTKADALKGFKEQLEALYSRRDVLAHQIKRRGEIRPVECGVELNIPTVGVKRVVRLDTGELIKDDVMTEDERQEQLFSESEEESEEIRRMFNAPDVRDTPPASEEPPAPGDAA